MYEFYDIALNIKSPKRKFTFKILTIFKIMVEIVRVVRYTEFVKYKSKGETV
ncbi:hypothetical protein PET01_14840 [Pediococcus ethanolidurans]|nr:hypothetical protein PET01_14840 [Pediococcus ethanolidurans]